jgi:hypothetical protein
MTLRQLLQRASDELADLHDEHGERFDFTFFVIRRSHELALEHHNSDAAKIVEHVSGPLSPNAGRTLLAAMIAILPADN